MPLSPSCAALCRASTSCLLASEKKGVDGRDKPGHDGLASMEGMRRGLDFEKAQAAFKRAAEKAMNGTREERSGRFLLVEGPDISRYNLFKESRGDSMTDKKHELYIERRSEGDYAVRRGGSERASVTAPTQKRAIEKAEKLDPKAAILVERVRDTKIGSRDKWRKP